MPQDGVDGSPFVGFDIEVASFPKVAVLTLVVTLVLRSLANGPKPELVRFLRWVLMSFTFLSILFAWRLTFVNRPESGVIVAVLPGWCFPCAAADSR